MSTDGEKPNVTCVKNQSYHTEKGKPKAMVKWEDPLALDNSGNVSVTCDPPSGADFPIGQTTITCKAVDSSGNRAECSFQVSVTGNVYMCALSLSYVFRCKFLFKSGCNGVGVGVGRYIWGRHAYSYGYMGEAQHYQLLRKSTLLYHTTY